MEPESYEVWDGSKDHVDSECLGFVAHEYDEELGWMWAAYRYAIMQPPGSYRGTLLEYADTAEDAEALLRNFWEG